MSSESRLKVVLCWHMTTLNTSPGLISQQRPLLGGGLEFVAIRSRFSNSF
jgi:hypothetical protein